MKRGQNVNRAHKQGLTIIEVLVSMAVATIAMIPLLKGLYSNQVLGKVIHYQYATQLLRAQLLMEAQREDGYFSQSFEMLDITGKPWKVEISTELYDEYTCRIARTLATGEWVQLEYCKWRQPQ
jgi:prepilin-type N-terminal cleavage/methylation domain-containing protein